MMTSLSTTVNEALPCSWVYHTYFAHSCGQSTASLGAGLSRTVADSVYAMQNEFPSHRTILQRQYLNEVEYHSPPAEVAYAM